MVKSKTPRTVNTTIMKNRGACILKKARELSVLCDIRVCALISLPNEDFHTWPENRTEAFELLKQFNNVEKNKKRKSSDVADNALTKERKMKKSLDFSCFDDGLINKLFKDSVTEISQLLASKIEAARKRAEFLKEKMTLRDKGFQQFNGNPSFDQSMFTPYGMMLNFPSVLPSSMGVPDFDSCFGQEQLGAVGLGNNCNSYSEPEIILDLPPPLSYAPSVTDFRTSLSLDNGFSSIRVPEIMLDYSPPLSYSCDNGFCTSDRYWWKHLRSVDESVKLLQHSPLELEEDMFDPASMATIPSQPLDYLFDY